MSEQCSPEALGSWVAVYVPGQAWEAGWEPRTQSQYERNLRRESRHSVELCAGGPRREAPAKLLAGVLWNLCIATKTACKRHFRVAR